MSKRYIQLTFIIIVSMLLLSLSVYGIFKNITAWQQGNSTDFLSFIISLFGIIVGAFAVVQVTMQIDESRKANIISQMGNLESSERDYSFFIYELINKDVEKINSINVSSVIGNSNIISENVSNFVNILSETVTIMILLKSSLDIVLGSCPSLKEKGFIDYLKSRMNPMIFNVFNSYSSINYITESGQTIEEDKKSIIESINIQFRKCKNILYLTIDDKDLIHDLNVAY